MEDKGKEDEHNEKYEDERGEAMEEEQNEKEDTRRMSAKAPPHKGCVNFPVDFLTKWSEHDG